MRTTIVLVIAILAQASGNVLLSKTMKHVVFSGEASLAGWIRDGLHIAQNPMIWAGTALLLLFFLLYSAALSWADLSFVLPATAFGYVVNVAFGHYFLGETVSAFQWGGTVLIMFGVALVSKNESIGVPT